MKKIFSRRNLLSFLVAMAFAVAFQNCAPQNLSTPVSSKVKTSSGHTNESSSWCSIQVPTSIAQNQELSVFVSSGGLESVQASTDGQKYTNFTTSNGSNYFPANSFPVGSYSLYFRGLKNDGTSILCSPATVKLEILSPTSNPSPVPDSGGTPGATIYRDYSPLVGYAVPGSAGDPLYNAGFKNFKEVYKPQSSMLMNMGSSGASGENCYRISTRHYAEIIKSNKFRVYLPPGTKTFFISILTYGDQTTEQVAAYRFRQPPVSTIDKAEGDQSFWSADVKRNLEYIIAGREYIGKSGAGGNILPSFGTITGNSYINNYSFKSAQGGWLYMNFLRVIGSKAYHIETKACVEPAAYENWYKSAKWDSEGNPL